MHSFPGEYILKIIPTMYQCETSLMNQKLSFSVTFGLLYTVFDGLKVSNTPSLNGNLFSKSTNHSISELVIILVYILDGIA